MCVYFFIHDVCLTVEKVTQHVFSLDAWGCAEIKKSSPYKSGRLDEQTKN